MSHPQVCRSAAFELDIALQDANAQVVLKTCLIEVSTLLTDYDMRDTIFGEKLDDLVKEWWPDE